MKRRLTSGVLKRYFALCSPHKRAIFNYSFTLVVLGIVHVFVPLATSHVLNTIEAGLTEQFLLALAAAAALWLVNQIFYYLACSSYSVYLRDVFVDMNNHITHRVYDFSADELINIPRGRIITMAVDDSFDIAGMMEYITDLPFNFLTNVAMIVVLFTVDWRFGALVAATDVVYYLLANFLTRRAAKYHAAQRRSVDKLVNLISQTMDGVREIKTSHIRDNLDKKYRTIYQNFSARYMLRRKYHVHYQVNLRYIMYSVRVVIYLIAAGLLTAGELELGTVVMIINYASTIFENSYSTMESFNSLLECQISFNRVWQFLKTGRVASHVPSSTDHKLLGKVRLQNVSFSYASLPTLHRVSFTAEPNQITAIVGKTGSGKTTIFNLLLRLYTANSGKIKLDNVSLDDFSDEDFHKNVATVNQDSFLFDMSIRENLGLVNPSEAAQIEVCKRVGIHDMIMSLPSGYSTRLTCDGSNLSGGQCRLLALARALLSGAEILLLDEVTSSLDPATTKHITSVLKDLSRDHTIIVITHKKELMRTADKLILLKNGRVAAQGNYSKVAPLLHS